MESSSYASLWKKIYELYPHSPLLLICPLHMLCPMYSSVLYVLSVGGPFVV